MQIVSYKKNITPEITQTLLLPLGKDGSFIGTELATLAASGLTYVAMPATAVLPKQPAKIAKSVSVVTLDPVLLAEIKAASPHVALINQRVQEKISDKYSVGAEIKMLRLAPSLETTAYNAYVEDCRAWGYAEKAKLGL